MRFPSFPTVISLLALFISLGGTSYAVTVLDDDSVTTSKIKDGAVSSAKLQSLSVSNSKLASAAVDSAKIKDGSIDLADMKSNLFGDLTFKRPTILEESLANRLGDPNFNSWAFKGRMKVAAGSHLVLARLPVFIERETSGTTVLTCVLSRNDPGSTARTSTIYDRVRVPVSPDGSHSETLLLTSPVTVSLTTELSVYCGFSGVDPDTFRTSIGSVKWDALHITNAHAEPSGAPLGNS